MKAFNANKSSLRAKITLIFISFLLLACVDKEPINIGFLAGISGRVADLGIGGRNGAMLAIEMTNASGGISGRPLQLIVKDDKQDPTLAKQAFRKLIDKRVEAVIGPMTSSIALSLKPLADKAQMLLLSPTATATVLSKGGDYFMRVVASSSIYASKSAEHNYQIEGMRRTAVIYDKNNLAYTENWLNEYRRVFETLGGKVELVLTFTSSNTVNFTGLIDSIVTAAPDSLLVLANSVDAAAIAQQLRQRNKSIRLSTSEWAATERLIELGGKAVEGTVTPQFFDRNSRTPGYQAFHKAYFQRFGQEPGFAGLTGFDAANVIIDALKKRQPGEQLRDVILQISQFRGTQSELKFDANGDAKRATFLTTIRDGHYVPL